MTVGAENPTADTLLQVFASRSTTHKPGVAALYLRENGF